MMLKVLLIGVYSMMVIKMANELVVVVVVILVLVVEMNIVVLLVHPALHCNCQG